MDDQIDDYEQNLYKTDGLESFCWFVVFLFVFLSAEFKKKITKKMNIS